jgi:DNA-binding transcriptional MerR regulator
MAADVSIPKRERFKSSEVCSIAGVQPYILRSWEAEFPSLAKGRTKNGGRVYRRADVEFVLQIKSLVFTDGLTLGAARRRLDTARGDHVDGEFEGLEETDEPVRPEVEERLASVKNGLQGILDLLSGKEKSSEAQADVGADYVAPAKAVEPIVAPDIAAETPEAAEPQDVKDTPSEQKVS